MAKTVPQKRRPQAPASPSRVAPVVILAAALCVRLIVLAQLGGDPLLQPRGVLDDSAYVQMAMRVASGDVALAPDVYYLAPLYTYFLGLVFAITGGSIQAARLIQVLLGTGTVALVMLTAREWWGRRASLVAGALGALTGLLAFNEILILQSSIDPFLAAITMFALARAFREPSWRRMAAAGAALGLFALNRPNVLLVVAVVAAIWIVTRRRREAILQAVALGLGTLLVLGPCAIRNRAVAGEWVLVTSHGGLNYYIGNSPQADGTYRATPGVRPSIDGQREDVRKTAAAALGHAVTASEASSYYYGLARQWMREQPMAWLSLQFRKVALTFNAVDVGLNVSYTYFARDEVSLLSFLPVGTWFLIPVGLFGLIVGAPREPRAAYVSWVSFVPAYALGVAVFFVSSRYRLPLVAPLLAGCGAGADWLWTHRRDAARPALAVPVLAGLAALFAFANWPMRADSGRHFQREERILQLIMDRHFDEARRLLDGAGDGHPNPAAMYYRVGLAFKDRGEFADAAVALERAAAVNPDEGWIRFHLAEALVRTGRAADAIPHLEAARARGINPIAVAYQLASLYRSSGQARRASEVLASTPLGGDAQPNVLLQFGASATENGDLPLAERFLRDAVRRAPALAVAHEQLGVVLGRQRRGPEALAAFDTAVRLDPSRASAHFHLAVALAEAGRIDAARAAAEQALRLRPDDGAARALLAQLSRR
jgi:tetratricopeptide (TPR) repeat protein